MKPEVLYLENIITAQPAGQNLDYVSLSLQTGEILGITGLGSSGIAVLADVLSGGLLPSGGAIYLDGKKVVYRSKQEARRLGIFEITYNASIVSDLSVSENLNVLQGFSWRKFVIRRKANHEIAQAIFDQYNITANPEKKARSLTEEQRVELAICRALLCGAKVLICREVGEGFSCEEMDGFVRFLHQLRDEGISVILCNSDVQKVLRYADRITVMRTGMVCWECDAKNVSAVDIYRRMCLPEMQNQPQEQSKPPALFASVQNLEIRESDGYCFSADIYTGKSLGILCKGSDRMNVFYRMFSGSEPTRGMVVQNQHLMHFSQWRHQNRRAIHCLQARFWENGLFENLTAAENILLRSMCRFDDRMGIINRRMLRLALKDFAAAHNFDPDALQVYPRQLPDRLHNQIVLLGMLFIPAKLLVLDHPFYTIDEQIKQDLLHCIAELRAQNTAILWSSNDISVLQNHCDYITEYNRN